MAKARSAPPWACSQITEPTVHRGASKRARPFPYKDPAWVFRLVNQYARDHPAAWGGFYFDRSPRGEDNPILFHVLFADDVARHAKAVRARAKNPTAFRFSRAPVAWAEIRALSRRIAREQFDRNPPEAYLGYEVIYVGDDEPRNLVEVGLEDYSPEAGAAYRERYGSRVCVKRRDAQPFELY